MESLIYHFSLLSSTFVHGAYQTRDFNIPELRATSVRGMIRWWYEALYNKQDEIHQIFGAINPVSSSRICIRIQSPKPSKIGVSDFIPHKDQRGGSKNAIQPQSPFILTISQRRGVLSASLWKNLQRAAEAWLLLGSIGQRSNRAAGSILWDNMPTTRDNFEQKATEVLKGSKIVFAILDKTFKNETEARRLAGDFLHADTFHGTTPFGSAKPRKPSPLKLKCIRLDNQLHLLAIWDHRSESAHHLRSGIEIMQKADKPLGHLLAKIVSQFTHS